MNSHLKTLIDRIFDHLRQHGSAIPDKRRVGISADHFRAALAGFGLQVPDDLLELYTYCDGTSTYEGDILGEIQFFPGFYWMSFDDVLKVYRALSGGDEWEKAWLPIFANGGGDFYAVICDSASPYFGEVVGFIIEEADQIVEFKNVTSMFETIEQSFADGAFFSSDGKLKADYPKMRAIAHHVQPAFMEHEI